MKPKKLFRTALFGYRKKDVYAYLDDYAKDTMEKLQQKDLETSRYLDSFRALNEECSALRRRIDDYEEDRDRIASVIIKAEETAELMIERAHQQAINKKIEIEEKIEVEAAKLQTLRIELNKLLKVAYETTSFIKKELGDEQVSKEDYFI